jgi:hypothetical protein
MRVHLRRVNHDWVLRVVAEVTFHAVHFLHQVRELVIRLAWLSVHNMLLRYKLLNMLNGRLCVLSKVIDFFIKPFALQIRGFFFPLESIILCLQVTL